MSGARPIVLAERTLFAPLQWLILTITSIFQERLAPPRAYLDLLSVAGEFYSARLPSPGVDQWPRRERRSGQAGDSRFANGIGAAPICCRCSPPIGIWPTHRASRD
jgi:hypothetical protein